MVLWTLLGIALVWIPADVYYLHVGGVEATISWQVLTFVTDNPITVVLVGLALGILTRHLFTNRWVPFFSWSQPFLWFLLSIAVGWLLATSWVQRGDGKPPL